MIFKRPKQPDYTSRHLFVGNCGPALGVDVECVRSIFLPFLDSPSSADLEVHMPWSAAASHVYVSLPSQQEAARAVRELTGKACEAAGGRVLIVKYAAVEEPKQVMQQPPVALSSQEAGIPGLQIHTDFITPEEEQALLQHIDQQPWVHLAKRRVQHYGYKFEYSQRGVDPKQNLGSLPDWVQPLQSRLERQPDVLPLDQLTINEYIPGVGLSAHIDTHSAFTGAILSVSLAGGCVMEFRKPIDVSSSTCSSSTCTTETPAEQGQAASSAGAACVADSTEADAFAAAEDDSVQRVLVYLPPRSLVVMGGESRYAWQHYIPHRKADWVNGTLIPRAQRRVSLTFRQVRGYPCTCSYPEFCDSQLGVLPPTRISQLQQQEQLPPEASAQQHGHQQQQAAAQSENTGSEPAAADSVASPSSSTADPDALAAAMEAVHVVQVYDAIAGHFSSTRFAVWPKVRAFLESLPAHSVVADVGCGNGKYFGVRRDLAVLGSDRSQGLAGVAMHRLRGGNTAAATGQGPIASPAADVLVCDGLQLPYKHCSCDAVLCIAVLHHMGSRGRRIKLLQELAAVLVPGGKGLVTVWATEQEDPDKTVRKWKKIKDAESSTELQQQVQEHQQREGPSVQGDVCNATTGPDYMVPWHLPFHKAAGLVKQQGCLAVGEHVSEAISQRDGASQGLQIDQAKGAVVLQRYYHLYEQHELEGLVRQVPGLVVVDSFYDRSNWCVIFQKEGDSSS